MKVVVEADGGSRGNPGPAGYGALVRDAASGAVLAERYAGIGVATNNVAEYQGLIAGLRAAADLGADDVLVRMDSKLVVEQMSGRWQVKHPAMKPLAAQAREVARAFATVAYEWIPRARNGDADELANRAMDEQAGIEPSGAATGTAAHVTAPPAVWSGAVGEPTRLYLVRHGQTALSVERRYSGRGNPALTDVGRRQAAAVGRRVTSAVLPAVVLSSPLDRALTTARAISADVVVDEDLVEVDFGTWEGLTFAEAADRDPDLHRRWLGDSSVPAPGGESFDEVLVRVGRLLDRVLDRWAGRDVVLVSHVSPIKQLLRLGLDVGPTLLYRLHLDLASVSVVEFYPDGFASVRSVNDTSHLV
ncbi:bifunctional RNase H/acid phosphatase [Saccharothrix violaceirubra]|uniref:Broad specificity phosphatase PhoE/ribonuclease HI n=1 Tax=Saccharothrix violaceirubra TaxID=413306 RepID=A0A7W7WYR3_9PSEU|nr:bifunctional RNase H/acid phosphatase [Saccharothrix violaceirubra]MBB4968266.1 broad specificity phosphatase PhoE/ribonuclease HI [Saccharothrix violaceirubra]